MYLKPLFYNVYSTYRHCILASFPSGITNSMGLETVSHLETKNCRTVAKRWPKWTPGEFPNDPKAMKMDTWTSRCLLGVPVDPGSPKGHSGYQKWNLKVSQMTVFCSNKWPISAVNRSAAACWQGGWRQGRSLKIYLSMSHCDS